MTRCSASYIFFVVFGMVMALAAVPSRALAQAAIVREETAFRNLIRDRTLLNFDTFSEPIFDQYPGVFFAGLHQAQPATESPTFTSPISGANVLDAETVNGQGQGGFALAFAVPVTGVGLWFDSQYDDWIVVRALDAGDNVIGSFESTAQSSDQWKFVGIVALSPTITRLEVETLNYP